MEENAPVQLGFSLGFILCSYKALFCSLGFFFGCGEGQAFCCPGERSFPTDESLIL